MMSFFTAPSFYAPVAPQPTFTTLFRLLDDFDSCAREAQSCQPRYHRRQRPTPTFRPRFDVRETEDAYELHGDLAGVERENLNIEFTGPQTMVVNGRVVRKYEIKPRTETEGQTEEPATPQPEAAAEPEKKDEPVNNHHATVEDDPEDETASTLSSSWTSPTPSETPRTEVAKPAADAEVEKTPAPEPATNDKVWVFERTVGEFSRTFSFPGRVSQESVTATLDNGVLSVTVPKAKTPVTRRIVIN